MKFFLLSIFILLINTCTNAQNDHWSVAPGNSIKESLGDSIIYRYPQFIPGFVYFRDGSISRGSLNLNFVTGEMQFINPSNDTMTVANEVTIKFIVIETDTFYFDKYYIELLHGNAVAKLGKISAIVQTDLKKEGGYGQMSSTSGITTVSSIYTGNRAYKLTEKSEVTVGKKTIYLIGDTFNHFMVAHKKNILKMFNSKASAIELFIKENKTSFTNETDLNKLVDFIGNN